MPCYFPNIAYKSLVRKTSLGKAIISFNPKYVNDAPYEEIKLPCGKCIGCQLKRAKSWALRCVNEASLFENNCFITLTFDDENLNKWESLDKKDFQNFMKLLRKRNKGLEEVEGKYPIRYFHCGEYGEMLGRPHHHACLFNFDFLDKILWKERLGNKLYRSEELERCWPHGYSVIGSVTLESAAYVARYVTKKVYGDRADSYYTRPDPDTGEAISIQPEYITMSRRPGIGKRWFERYRNDCYPKDFTTENGCKFSIPSYYDGLYELDEPNEFRKLKERRKKHAKENLKDSRKRLRQRERCVRLKQKVFKREYEKNGLKNV